MKKALLVCLVTVCLLGALVSCGSSNSKNASAVNVKDPATLEEQSAYSMGGLIFNSNKEYLGLNENNVNYFIRGMYDAANNKFLYNDEEAQNFISQYSEIVLNKMQTENLEQAEAFLASNKSAEGVVVTDSGLQYKVLTEGSGKAISENDTVDVMYTLSNIDGDVIEEVNSSNGGPVSFSPSQLVPGIKEGLCLMKVGAKYRFWVHPSLGYGDTGAGNIEPNQLLVFDFEVVDVK